MNVPFCVAMPGSETTSVDCRTEFVSSTGSVTNLFDGSGVGVGAGTGVGVGVGSGVGVGVAAGVTLTALDALPSPTLLMARSFTW